MKGEFANASESFKRLNPQLFGALGAMVRPKPQQGERGEGEDRCVGSVPKSVGYRITIISIRKRLVDAHDNLRSAHKPIVDRITEWLGFKSDSDENLNWNYDQLKTTGKPGTIVLIERR